MSKRRRGQPPPEPPEFVTEVINEESLKKDLLPPVVIVPKDEVTVLGHLVDGKTPMQAMKAAGLRAGRRGAEVYCGKVLDRYGPVIIDALLRRGITVDTIADKLAGQLDAKKYIKMRQDGETVLVAVEDNSAIQGAIDKVLDVLPGSRAPKQMQIEKRSLEMILLQIASEDGDEDE